MDRPSLEGCHLKLSRAAQHAEELRRLLRPVLDLIEAATVVNSTYDAHSDEFTVKVVYAPGIPPMASVIAGDVIHNLRSALDHLAYQAVWRNRGTPWSRSQFPIADDPLCYSKSDLVLFRRLGPDFTAIFKRHQPYKSESDFIKEGWATNVREGIQIREANRPLMILRELSNRDKHRWLLPSAALAMDPDIIPSRTRDCEPQISMHYSTEVELVNRAPLAVFTGNATGPNPQMDVDYKFRPSVQIGAVGEAEEVLDALAAKVVRIVGECEPLF